MLIRFGQIKQFWPFDTIEGRAILNAIRKQCELNDAIYEYHPHALGDTFELKRSGAEPIVFKNPRLFAIGKTDRGFFLTDGREKEILSQVKEFRIELYGHEEDEGGLSNKSADGPHSPESLAQLDSMDQLSLGIAQALTNGKEETILPQIRSFSDKLIDHLNKYGTVRSELFKGRVESLYQNVAKLLAQKSEAEKG